MTNIFENYTHLYPVSKTLKFSLIPMFETEQNINAYGVLENDRIKAEKYVKVKAAFDKCHRAFIEKSLMSMSVDWETLYKSYMDTRQQSSAAFEHLSAEYRKAVSEYFTGKEEYRLLKPETVIKSVVKNEYGKEIFSEEEKETIKLFNRFSSYFSNYHILRENIYSDRKNSIAFRLINDNFPRFVTNISIFQSLDSECIRQAQQKMAAVLKGISLDEIFTVDFYNNVLTQNGIDFYNSVIGGLAVSETERISGLNEFLYSKYQSGEVKQRISFSVLYRQILSDGKWDYFALGSFESDFEAIEALNSYGKELNKVLDDNIADLKNIFSIANIDMEKVYVSKSQLAALSAVLYDGKSNELRTKLKEKGIKKENIYSLATLQKVTSADIAGDVLSVFLGQVHIMKNSFFRLNKLFKREKIDNYTGIKAYLDSVKECAQILKIFDCPFDADRDITFYSVFDAVYGVLHSNISLYNKIRNYAVKKPYSEKKFKLNFDSPILANGWDQNQEYTNNIMLFIKDGLYYVAVLNAKNKEKIEESSVYSEGSYKKMVYKLLPSPGKMLPKVFFSAKWLKGHNVDQSIIEGYKLGRHKKGENFDLEFCHRLIDYFKEGIKQHKDWSKFDFNLSETGSYRDIGEFYNEIAGQNYRLSFSYVAEEEIKRLVSAGNIFLFQIYNKDFSKAAKGKPNLHTLYWKEIFSRENIKNPVYKLNGNAELFYRPASVVNPFVHRQGSILVGKTDSDMLPVESAVYKKALQDTKSGMTVQQLQEKYPKLSFRISDYDITKDNRYSKPSYYFHVPITINYGCEDRSLQLNKMVLADISANKDVNIIGIARGERNLVYAVVINQQGDILCQKSFNEIHTGKNSVNYQAKLDGLENTRYNERKNWKKISNIKELKEGYLSAVIKEIADMMIKYNGIVVLENLDTAFKDRRVRVEKQIYQQFEKKLTDKLNFFADKTADINEKGSLRHGYQLSGKSDSLAAGVKQSGFLFYVPPSYSSTIDPVTGFVNLFTSRQLVYHSVRQTKAFFEKFADISFDHSLECFRFVFKYSDFDISAKDYTDNWVVYSYGKGRIVHTRENGIRKRESIDVTRQLAQLFREYSVDYSQENLKQQILAVEKKDFWIKLLFLFKTIVQLRYENEKEYFILSPVHKNGKFFDGRVADSTQPENVDANGAYHIALQGLRIIRNRINNGKIIPDGPGKQIYNWLEFVQKKSIREDNKNC